MVLDNDFVDGFPGRFQQEPAIRQALLYEPLRRGSMKNGFKIPAKGGLSD